MVMDPDRLEQWVTIHRRLIRADEPPLRVGFRMDQQIHLRGVNLQVHWTLVDCRRPELAVWEGRGPARSRAHTECALKAQGRGTRFDYRNEFHPPLGPLGAVVSRALVAGMSAREASMRSAIAVQNTSTHHPSRPYKMNRISMRGMITYSMI